MANVEQNSNSAQSAQLCWEELANLEQSPRAVYEQPEHVEEVASSVNHAQLDLLHGSVADYATRAALRGSRLAVAARRSIALARVRV